MKLDRLINQTRRYEVAIKAERNLLGRLVFLAQENDINLEKLFEYPLGPIPWSLATAGGRPTKLS